MFFQLFQMLLLQIHSICDQICEKESLYTFSLPTLTNHNFRIKTAIAMKFGQ